MEIRRVIMADGPYAGMEITSDLNVIAVVPNEFSSEIVYYDVHRLVAFGKVLWVGFSNVLPEDRNRIAAGALLGAHYKMWEEAKDAS